MENVILKRCAVFACCLGGGLLFSTPPPPALAQTGGAVAVAPAVASSGQGVAQPAEQSTGEDARLPSFVYQREGRPDPFLPFLSQEILKAGGKPGMEPMGLQKLEAGQLDLVAIVFGEREAVAMVQDSAGMGYVIRKGSRIGRSGTVKDILPNKVLIEQTESTPASTETRVVEMILKEGEKE